MIVSDVVVYGSIEKINGNYLTISSKRNNSIVFETAVIEAKKWIVNKCEYYTIIVSNGIRLD